MPFIERTNKPTIYYELSDYTDPWKNAPVILLQHGFGRSSRFWYSWVPYLSRFYRVVRPDLRGLGNSSAELDLERDIGLEQYIDDFNAIIDDVGAESVHLCGESFGGILSIAFASLRPERVRTLTLIATPVRISEKDKQTTSYGHESRIDAVKKMGIGAWAKASSAGRRFPPDADPGMLSWYADERIKAAKNIDVLDAMFRWVSNVSAVPYLANISAPVLGLYPSLSDIHDEEQFRQLKEQVRNIRLIHFPFPYHAIQNIKPAACALEVLHFAAQFDGISCHE